MLQDQPGISKRMKDLYGRAAAAVGAVEREYGAGEEAARLAEADFLRELLDGEELADRHVAEPPRRRLEKGLVHVYTGDGKGKTTAAFGLAMRALGAGLRVCIVQFLKGGAASGEIETAQRLPRLKVIRTSVTYNPAVSQAESAELRAESRATFEKARILALVGEYDLIILDEINLVLFYKFVKVEELLELIQGRPETLEMVFTGRYAPPELLAAADLVTEMKEIKHPAAAGFTARRGIEF